MKISYDEEKIITNNFLIRRERSQACKVRKQPLL